MKVCIIQPPYSMNYVDIDACFNKLISLLDGLNENLDVIVLPEYSDVLANTPTAEDFVLALKKYSPIIDKKVKETAKRLNSIIFANYGFETELGYRNTTHVIDRNGVEIGKYYKVHPAPSELRNKGIDTEYSNYPQEIYTIDIEGVRFGFRTCYDFYFYEDIVQLARKNLDVIIGCSYQRTDTHEALEIMNRFLCYNTNAYLLRASVSMGEDSKVGGCSMIVSPNGTILSNLKNEVGKIILEINPKEKYYKASGFGGAPKSHYEYVDEGRKK